MADLTQAQANELINYDSETGSFTWKPRGPAHFSGNGEYTAERLAKVWNTKFSGTDAGTVLPTGYLHINVDKHRILAHRLAWLIMYGSFPAAQIDHINGCRTDNRISNLREATETINSQNRRLQGHNTSGVVGVSYCSRKNRWRANIVIGRKQKHLGYFYLFDDAVKAREEAAVKYGFHPNHGRKAA